MALIDDSKAYILRMFQMEVNEGRGSYCRVFPSGSRQDDLPLDSNEMVYGIYKDKYIFTPRSLILRDGKNVQRLMWAEITGCSTKHGCGEKRSVITISDGTTVIIELHELAKGWAGRISQLLHGMISRWGRQATLGPALLSLDEFLSHTTDAYDFAPNLEPHPPLETIIQILSQLSSAANVHSVLLSPADDDTTNGTAITGVVVVSNGRPNAIEVFAHALNATAVLEATENTLRKVNAASSMKIWEVVWD